MPKSKNMFSANGVNADVSTMEVSFAGKSQKVEGESCPIVIEITGECCLLIFLPLQVVIIFI